MSTEKSDNYYRGVCRRRECAAYTAAGNVASYWHGPHRHDRAQAAADYDTHVRERHQTAAAS